MPLLSDREKSILEKGEIVHNKRFFFFRQCFRDYNTYPFILASVRDRVKEINSYILYSEHDMQNVSRVCYSLFLLVVFYKI